MLLTIINLLNYYFDIFKKFKYLEMIDKALFNGKGQELWKRATKVIPGGNMLLSKRSEMFLPNYWPSYYSKAKGCKIWDLDDNKFLDLSIMGIGTNILGYCHKEIDSAIKDVISKGNLTTLNCPEEVLLAEKLVALHPWSNMVRFARSGGEANSIAIRIARAATGRDHVAICGYHGWHDWYLATNLQDDSGLEEHLLPGLEPNGVPKVLKNTTHPFSFNNIEQVKIISEKYDLAAIKLEVQRNEEPKKGFIEEIRKICTKKGIVLIFDECTSGFREEFGGIHKKFNFEPDMAMFGKSLGNGYAITAVIGKDSVMQAAQSTFISSTFWTERIGPTAALKTLEIMEREKSWEKITQIGKDIKTKWQKLADSLNLKITHTGIPALAGFRFEYKNNMAYKTLITQEMLKRGFLADNRIYVSTEHSEKIIEDYFSNLSEVFKLIKDCEEDKLNINELLLGPVCHSGFKRLN